MSSKPLRVAIVGSGAAGLSALWTLRQTPEKFEIHLFEAGSYIGGHTNTVPFRSPDGRHETMVDTGFIVCNEATYPNFFSFLKAIDIAPVPTSMTLSVSRDSGAFEWAGTNFLTVFAQKRNFFDRSMWRMLFDIVRFNHFAEDILEEEIREGEEEESIGEYLEREGYSELFKNNYLIPMTAAIWSTSPDKCSLKFPAVTLVQFLKNHRLLNTITSRPQWYTIPGGSIRYIRSIIDDFPSSNIHLNTTITSLHHTPTSDGSSNHSQKIFLTTSTNETHKFDHVIFAVHGDQALSILGDNATDQERDILQHFKCSENIAVLHNDISLMPKRKQAWTAWNYITRSASSSPSSSSLPTNIPQVSLTYDMNILQHIPTSTFGHVLVTLNPLFAPPPSSSPVTFKYRHPLYTPAAILSQHRLPNIQNKRGITFAGAWTGYGFHEDAFRSGMAAAIGIGGMLPKGMVWKDTVRPDYRTRMGRKEGKDMGWLVVLVRWIVVWIGWVIGWASGFGEGIRKQGKSEERGKAKKL